MKLLSVTGAIAGAFLAAAGAGAQVPLTGNSTLFDATLGTNFFDRLLNPGLDSAAGLTNPLFTLTQGDALLFGISLVGSRPDQVTATFAGAPATLSDPNVNGTVTYVPTLGGGASYTERLTFNTVGSYSGTITVNALLTDQDYQFSGSTARREAPTFTYRVNVLAAAGAAVPEPATWATLVLGFGLAGAALRRRRRAAA